MKTIHLSFTTTEEVAQELELRGKKEVRTKSAIINIALKEFFFKTKKQNHD
jgi:hypothetical protein